MYLLSVLAALRRLRRIQVDGSGGQDEDALGRLRSHGQGDGGVGQDKDAPGGIGRWGVGRGWHELRAGSETTDTITGGLGFLAEAQVARTARAVAVVNFIVAVGGSLGS